MIQEYQFIVFAVRDTSTGQFLKKYSWDYKSRSRRTPEELRKRLFATKLGHSRIFATEASASRFMVDTQKSLQTLLPEMSLEVQRIECEQKW